MSSLRVADAGVVDAFVDCFSRSLAFIFERRRDGCLAGNNVSAGPLPNRPWPVVLVVVSDPLSVGRADLSAAVVDDDDDAIRCDAALPYTWR